MHRTAFAFGLLLCAFVASPASADPYRWCAVGIGGDGLSNCYFLTLEQCRAAVSGAGYFCRPNNFYTGADDLPRRTKQR